MGLDQIVGANRGLLIGLNYVITILVFQLGMMLVIRWYLERKKQIKNKLIMIFGIYYVLFSLSYLIYSFIIFHGIAGIILYSSLWISILLITIGGFCFSYMVETTIKKSINTRYTISILLFVLFILMVAFQYFPISYVFRDVFNTALQIPPMILTLYFIRNTHSKVRLKLQISFLGFVVLLLSFYFSSLESMNLILNLFILWFSVVIIMVSKFLMLLGLALIFYGFGGYSFFLELEWKDNLISLYVIDKSRRISLYQKLFLKYDIKHEEMFAGGITGIMGMIKEFMEAKKDIEEIRLKNNLILMQHGEKIITALLLKKKLKNAPYILGEITSKFALIFGEYLESDSNYELASKDSSIFRPMDLFIKDLLKM